MFEKKELNVLSFGLACGITFGVYLLLIGMIAWIFNWGTTVVQFVGSFYYGFAPTFVGSLLGGLWAFIDAFIGGVIFAWLYNFFSRLIKK